MLYLVLWFMCKNRNTFRIWPDMLRNQKCLSKITIPECIILIVRSGSIPGCVIPRSMEMVHVVSLLGTPHWVLDWHVYVQGIYLYNKLPRANVTGCKLLPNWCLEVVKCTFWFYWWLPTDEALVLPSFMLGVHLLSYIIMICGSVMLQTISTQLIYDFFKCIPVIHWNQCVLWTALVLSHHVWRCNMNY